MDVARSKKSDRNSFNPRTKAKAHRTMKRARLHRWTERPVQHAATSNSMSRSPQMLLLIILLDEISGNMISGRTRGSWQQWALLDSLFDGIDPSRSSGFMLIVLETEASNDEDVWDDSCEVSRCSSSVTLVDAVPNGSVLSHEPNRLVLKNCDSCEEYPVDRRDCSLCRNPVLTADSKGCSFFLDDIRNGLVHLSPAELTDWIPGNPLSRSRVWRTSSWKARRLSHEQIWTEYEWIGYGQWYWSYSISKHII